MGELAATDLTGELRCLGPPLLSPPAPTPLPDDWKARWLSGVWPSLMSGERAQASRLPAPLALTPCPRSSPPLPCHSWRESRRLPAGQEGWRVGGGQHLHFPPLGGTAGWESLCLHQAPRDQSWREPRCRGSQSPLLSPPRQPRCLGLQPPLPLSPPRPYTRPREPSIRGPRE